MRQWKLAGDIADVGPDRDDVVQRRHDVCVALPQEDGVVLGMAVGGGHQPERELRELEGQAIDV